MFLDKDFYIDDVIFIHGVTFNDPRILDTFIEIVKSLPNGVRDEFLRIFDENTCIVIFEKDSHPFAAIVDLKEGDILSINLYVFAKEMADANTSKEEKCMSITRLLHSLLYH